MLPPLLGKGGEGSIRLHHTLLCEEMHLFYVMPDNRKPVLTDLLIKELRIKRAQNKMLFYGGEE